MWCEFSYLAKFRLFFSSFLTILYLLPHSATGFELVRNYCEFDYSESVAIVSTYSYDDYRAGIGSSTIDREIKQYPYQPPDCKGSLTALPHDYQFDLNRKVFTAPVNNKKNSLWTYGNFNARVRASAHTSSRRTVTSVLEFHKALRKKTADQEPDIFTLVPSKVEISNTYLNRPDSFSSIDINITVVKIFDSSKYNKYRSTDILKLNATVEGHTDKEKDAEIEFSGELHGEDFNKDKGPIPYTTSFKNKTFTLSIPIYSNEINLDDLEVGQRYIVKYFLQAKAETPFGDGDFAEAFVGDPLDTNSVNLITDSASDILPPPLRSCGEQAYDDTRYTNHGDSTLTDNHTGLMWQRCSLGQLLDDKGNSDITNDRCIDVPQVTLLNWQDALLSANNDTSAGYSDWRVPNVKELQSLVATCESPAIEIYPFPDPAVSGTWSSTPALVSNNAGQQAWQLSFSSGVLLPFDKSTPLSVRLVRDSGTPPQAPLPALSAGKASIIEGDSGTQQLSLPVTLSKPATSPIIVDYETVSESATAGEDFQTASGQLTFPAGVTITAVNIIVNGDIKEENTEQFALGLFNASANARISVPYGTGTIVNDEPKISIAPTIQFDEGDSGTVNRPLIVQLNKTAALDITVDYQTIAESATAASDYAEINGTLTILAGQNQGVINLPIHGDTLEELDETLQLILSNPVNASLIGGLETSATIIILDNDTTATSSTYIALNDTGVDFCATDSASHLACPQADFPGQDGQSGRDISANDDSDGIAGFVFTKLDNNGQALADQSQDYFTQAWDCARDEVTGLWWEVKEFDRSLTKLRGFRHFYSWHNTSGINDGGDPGQANGGRCAGSISCDTEAYINAINALNLCGHNDWRLPSADELFTLVFHGPQQSIAPAGLDNRYFPFHAADGAGYWSSTPQSDDPARAWQVSIRNIGTGLIGSFSDRRTSAKSSGARIRLVRTDN